MTDIPGWLWDPEWSPDGTKLAFVRNVDPADIDVRESPSAGQKKRSTPRLCRIRVYLIHLDGSGEVRLTHRTPPDFDPEFSPSGEFIVFNHWLESGSEHSLAIMSADGSEITRLNLVGFRPRWKK
ncbi:MAG: PD40 domain-containing protein [Gemmatimonadetes bacterium]|nr:PD40 domain-containing protein [Gemmatimonadota bacterium]